MNWTTRLISNSILGLSLAACCFVAAGCPRTIEEVDQDAVKNEFGIDIPSGEEQGTDKSKEDKSGSGGF